jgi:hypothetical protein
MELKNILSAKRTAVLKKWFDVILESYPPNTAEFLRTQKDPFANPVGHTIFEGMEGIFDELLEGVDSHKASVFLDNIIRVRAIQDFTPSQAVLFVFLLKKVIEEEVGEELRKEGLSEELTLLNSRIDKLALLAFDIYMKCREKLYELRAKELENRTFRLLKKANLVYEIQEQEAESRN